MTIPHFTKNALRGNRRVYLFMLATVGLLLLLLAGRAWGNSQGALASAYQRLTQLDGYSFVSRVNQTTHPLPTLANVGLNSERSSLLVEGTVKRRANQAELQISEQNGYLLDGLRQVELRVDEGQVWARAQGQEWQALDPTQALDNAANDPSLLLQAARNARPLGVEERLGQQFQLIAFDLDGVAWAAVMRQSLQREMIRRGELAPGAALERLPYYEEMTGAGTLWINEQGLPQRLTLHMVYPPLPNESAYREVETTTDFSQWQHGNLASQLASSVADAIPHTVGEAASSLSLALLLGLYLLLPLALLRYRQYRQLSRIVFLLLVTLLLGEPLLRTAAVHAADTRRANHYAAVDATAAETAPIQTAVEEIKADFAANFNMDQGALTGVLPQNALATITGQNAQQAPTPQDPTADSDGDGLDNATEATLGLDPNDPDSDGDMLSDGFEVTTQSGGKYLDPLSADTNGDEIQDTLECIQAIDVVLTTNGQATKSAPQGTGNCADTDGDGVPDFADDDNDNDGVADWMDGQPAGSFGDPTAGVPDDTFAFAVENYSDSNPLRVTLELRPTNPEHLWYTMNVLDWPSGDYEGQIRRVHDTTLGTTGAAANGDMQLVPMVEITLPAAEAVHLPTQPDKTPLAGDLVGDNSRLSEWLDMAVLERYQMAVSWAKDNQTLLVYLPATLIRDKHGNAPVNFVATMRYGPSGAGLFASVHRARLAWLVQMDHDSCVAPEGSTYAESCLPHGADYDKGAHWQTAQRQLVHRYYDSFTVTAFTAEEDVRANAQLFYEDPTEISSPTTYLPDQLLAFGTLLEGYLRAAETPTTALAAYQAAQPALSNRLVAGELLQDTDIYGLIAQLATQEAPRLLDSEFAGHHETLPHPALLYVIWGQSNVVGLSGSSAGDSLRLNMAEATPKHATTIRLGTFAYEPNPAMVGGKQNPHWIAADPGGVWLDYLQGQGAAAYAQLPAAAQARFSAADFSQIALGLFWNLARGITLPTDLSGSTDDSAQAGQDLVSNLGGGFDMAGENTIGAWISVLDDFEEAQRTLRAGIIQAGMLDMAGKSVSTVANLQGALRTARWVKTMGLTSVTMAGLSATLAVVSVLADNLGLGKGAMAALDATNAGLGLTLAGALTALEVTKVVQTVQAAGSAALDALGDALAFENTLSEVGLVAALAVTAVILVTTLVTFVGMLMDGNGTAAKAALAQGAATAILVVLLFAISTWFPIGTAIALLIGLIDGVITAVCKIWSWAGGTDGSGQTFADRHASLCAGVVGTVTTAVAGFFYKTLPMVDMGYKDRLQFGPTDTQLISVENRYGLSVGNLLQVTQPLTVTVRLPAEHDFFSYSEIQVGGHEFSAMAVSEYKRLITETNVFNYELITNQDADSNPALADKMSAERWQDVPVDRQSAAVQRDGLLYKTVYRDMLYKVARPSLQLTLTAGINWHPDLFVREYYRYSLAECEVAYCDHAIDDFTKSVAGTQAITIGTHLIYDVFPATLTDFYTLEEVLTDGQVGLQYRLAWGGAQPFPALVDADGDGLRGDLDPDDKIADADADGLPDAFEVRDSRLDPLLTDTDGDGLGDYDETRWGTRPDRADSDGDGLSDYAEQVGWELRYTDAAGASHSAWVTSDPLLFDTDGDGLADQQERVLVTHPRARNTDLQVLSLRTGTAVRESTYLAPGQTIAFTATVANELAVPTAYGLLETDLLGTDAAIAPLPFTLQPQQQEALHGTIQVPADAVADGAEVLLRNRAGANIIDPAASYAAQLEGLPSTDPGLRFHLRFDTGAAVDDAGTFTVNCAVSEVSTDSFCPSIGSGATFNGGQWYTVTGDDPLITQPRFSIGGWVTVHKAFGEEYDERIFLGPDDLGDDQNNYLQLSLTGLHSGVPQVKLKFTATDGTICEQTLPQFQIPYDVQSHIFVTYNGTDLYGYLNGQRVAAANLQNCQNKVPSVRRLAIGRGPVQATLYLHAVHFNDLDEGGGGDAEPYLEWNGDGDAEVVWRASDVSNGDTKTVDVKRTLSPGEPGTYAGYIQIWEEDDGQGALFDPDDWHGDVFINPLRPGLFDEAWSSNEGNGTLRYNVQNNLFQGRLDELRIYNRELSPEEVHLLMTGGDRLIYQLDEAPGSSGFRNAGVDATRLICADNAACPDSGLVGYAGQAVRFNGTTNETLHADLGLEYAGSLLTGFWFKPASVDETIPQATPLRRSAPTDAGFGFTLHATQRADGASLRLAPNPAPDVPGTVGGNGGSPYTLNCLAGEALVGIVGTWAEEDSAEDVIAEFFGGEPAYPNVMSVGPLCVATTPDYRQWVGDPVSRGTVGRGGGGPFDSRCPTGSYVVGFEGTVYDVVGGIKLLCAPAGSPGVLESEHATKLPAVGYDEGAARPHCPFNLPANGILGRAGDMVDQFGLQCEDALPSVAAGVVPANAWSHIEVRQENNRVTLSINGEDVQTLENSTTANGATARSTLTLGGGIAGLVDEVIVQPEPKEGQQTYRDSAQVYLHLDETTGATTFVSSTAQGNGACDDTTSCVRAGLPGQVRESVQFNNDSTSPLAAGLAVALPDGGDAAFTTELWVRLSNAPTAPASLVALHETASSDRAGWRLQLARVEGETVPQLDLCGGALTVTPSDVDLVPNQWHHLALSFDATAVSQDFSLYHNGRLVHTEHLTGSKPGLNCPRGNTLRLGQSYTGQIDEFSYYGRALRPSEILSHYNYQDTWYEAITTERFQIDANPPTLKLSTGSYIQPGTHIFGVAVSDGEAGIRSVEYQDADGSWQPALTETVTRGVWTFGRDVQESTTISVRATDNVGNVSNASQPVAVDSTPPVVAMNPSATQRTLTATGSASDSGSGLHAVSIMIVDPSGQPLSPPRAIPLVDGSWTVSQELPADVAGEFQIWASAVDQLGNGFEGFVGSVQVDNAAPLLTLDVATPDTLVGSGADRPTLRVFVTDESAAANGAEAQTVQQVELGLLHRRDKDDSSQVRWQAMALVNTELITTTWALQLPADLDGDYDISLRAVDTLGNERVVPGVWTGAIDTRATEGNTAGPAGDTPAADPEQTWQVVSTFTGNGSGVNSVTWSPDGSYLAAGTDDGIILLWAVESGESLPPLAGHDGAVNSVAWSPDGNYLLSGADDGTMLVWNMETKESLRPLVGNEGGIHSVIWSTDGSYLVSGSVEGTVRVWSMDTGQNALLDTVVGTVNSLAWSPAETYLVAGVEDGLIRVWDLVTGERLPLLEGHEGGVNSVAWSPDGRYLASASADGTVRAWDPATGESALLPDHLAGGVGSVTWSPDGTDLAAGTVDGTIGIWDFETGSRLATLAGHVGGINSVVWSPTGNDLASGSADGTVLIWREEAVND